MIRDYLNWIIIIIGFIITYSILYFFTSPWPSPFYYLAPIAGFWIFLIASIKINGYFEWNRAIMPVFLIFCLFFAFLLTIGLYYLEPAMQQSNLDQKIAPYICFFELSDVDCQNKVASLNQINEVKVFPVYYWNKLKSSAYLSFMLSAIIGSIITYRRREK